MKQQAVFKLTITKLDGAVYAGEVESVTLPGLAGDFTILSQHAPLVSLLKAGVVRIRHGEEVTELTIEKGLVETSRNQVTVLI